MDANKDGVVTIEELVQWCSKDEELLRSLDTLDTVLWDLNVLSKISVMDDQLRFEQWRGTEYREYLFIDLSVSLYANKEGTQIQIITRIKEVYRKCWKNIFLKRP